MKILLKNIDVLWLSEEGNNKVYPYVREMFSNPPRIENAFLFAENGVVKGFGHMSVMDVKESHCDIVLDARNRHVFPGFCDSHTHVVFAKTRESEFVDKIKGLSYAEIARRGGGILNSARALHKASEEELYELALQRIRQLISLGTTAIEIKSGYGLTTSSELKILRVIRSLKETLPIPVRSTFLGAHAFPEEYQNKRDAYVDLIVQEMLPAVAEENLADFVDVFCDEGFFTPEQTEKIFETAIKWGLRPKIHANELGITGGVRVAVKYGAVSVDHLEHLTNEEIDLLANSATIPTALPGTSFFLRLPYAPMRKMVDVGLPLALASDFNPGSCPSGNMQFIWTLACIYGRLLPEEALVAMTINGACAMGLQDKVGSFALGKTANFILSKPLPSLAFIPYYYGVSNIEKVFVNGFPWNLNE
ncbi:MAG: imidazolonepropionase [Bacteroidales bacterium]|nr:imidazolonepropionase [Bacteroidales bacterium]